MATSAVRDRCRASAARSGADARRDCGHLGVIIGAWCPLAGKAICACGSVDEGVLVTEADVFEITVVYEHAGDGHLTASIPAVPGTISTGATRCGARRNVVDALGTMLSVAPDEVPTSATTER